MASIIQLRRGLSTLWTSANPVLAEGEQGFETDTQQSKYGDGVSAWNTLPYAGIAGPAGPAGSSTWGSVTGTLSAQTDLQTALNGKQPLAAVLTGTTASFTTAQETKLSGIATAATANATDASLRDRSTHTGTQAASTISDFSEAVDDRVGSLLVAGTNVTLDYNDAANTLTINSSDSNTIGGYPVSLTGLATDDLLSFGGSSWANRAAQQLTDGGNF